ncbi:MAG: hypothetical protein EOO65_01735 [Methanosarcinales archaeon]|nr:MAG: hypothetical protein EOO65_01735 [Methanosarcinales archaeon]
MQQHSAELTKSPFVLTLFVMHTCPSRVGDAGTSAASSATEQVSRSERLLALLTLQMKKTSGAPLSPPPADDIVNTIVTPVLHPSSWRQSERAFPLPPTPIVDKSAAAGEKPVVQPYFSRAIAECDWTGYASQLVDAHATATIGSLMPDLLVLSTAREGRLGLRAGTSHIVAVGDLKSFNAPGGPFTPNHIVQLLRYIAQLSLAQPWRCHFVGFLCDAVHICFMECYVALAQAGTTVRELTRCIQSGPFDLANEGGRWLDGLLCADHVSLGMLPGGVLKVGDESFHVGSMLGRGSTSTVLAAESTTGGAQYALKLLHQGEARHQAAALEQELQCLSETSHVEGVAHLHMSGIVSLPDQPHVPALVMFPQGEQLHLPAPSSGVPLMPTPADLTGMLQCLRSLHAAGWVHLDARSSNFVLHNGKLVLVDFGAAQRIGAAVATARGAWYHYPDEALSALATRRAAFVHPWWDFVILTKIVITIPCDAYFRALLGHAPSIQRVRDVWQVIGARHIDLITAAAGACASDAAFDHFSTTLARFVAAHNRIEAGMPTIASELP